MTTIIKQETVKRPDGEFFVSTVDLAGEMPGSARLFSALGGRYETMVFRCQRDMKDKLHVDFADLDCERTDDLASVDAQHEKVLQRWRRP
jgi:hypothetical protein